MEASEASGSKFHGRDAHDSKSQPCARERRRHRPCQFCLDESGIALPVALGVLLVVAGLATVGARASIVSNHQTFRDISVKRATQAAFAGVQALRYQTNLLQPGASQCVAKSTLDGALSLIAVQGDGWCDPQTEDLGNGASYTARASSATNVTVDGQLLAQRRIVSTGTAGGSRRRIALTIDAATGAPLFPAGYAAISLAAVDFGNTVALLNGGVASNGDVTLRNSANVCGPATPGPGRTLTLNNSASVCSNYATQPATQDFQLQPVTVGDTATANDDVRITNAISGTGSPADSCTSCDQISWNPATRSLIMHNNSTLTLSGNVYNFCRFEMNNNSQLSIAPRDPNIPLLFYIDSPEACGAGSGSVVLRNNSGIVNLNSDPRTLQLRVAGSPTTATSVTFANSFDTSMIMAVYAPNSTVDMNNHIDIMGGVAGKAVKMSNNTSITYDGRVGEINTGSTLRVYRSQDYIECTTEPTGAAHDSGC
jgi:hypothetical protein